MINSTETHHLCLTTLAVGDKYRQHALNLLKDVSSLGLTIPTIILTDQPESFADLQDVIPIKHKIKSVAIYHDKLYCIEEALKEFEGCIFLDADCRLLTNVVKSRPWKPGFTVKSSQNVLRYVDDRTSSSKLHRKNKLLSELVDKYLINVEDIKFVSEYFFVFKKDGTKHEKFLSIWKELRDVFESNRIFGSEGTVIGFAAHLAGLNIFHYDTGYPEEPELHRIDDVYKDKIFSRRMAQLPENIKDLVIEIDEKRNLIEKLALQNNTIDSRLRRILARETRFVKLITNQVLSNLNETLLLQRKQFR